jgi:ribose 5-phosphate isomerase
MSPGFSEFHRHYIFEVNKQGLIVDVRNNRGGHVSQLLLEILSRKRIGYDLSRYGNIQSYPSHSVTGTIVALTDEYSGSDGDIFSHNFKQMKLGILVGKRTWGGVIGINPRLALSDGSITTQPEYATYMNDVGWGVENYGTDPDIEIDITIDGADEADRSFNGIKGGGGALLFEKIVALSSKVNIWIIDSKKLVDKLGKFPLPVEVIPFGYKKVFEKLKAMNLNPVLRKKDNEMFFTDSGNYIIDLQSEGIDEIEKSDRDLKLITGVIETGLFIGIPDKIIIGRNNCNIRFNLS